MTSSLDRYIADAKFEWARGNASSALAYIGSAVSELESMASKIERLEDAERRLDALEAMGVDNWEGYDDAMRDYYGADD